MQTLELYARSINENWAHFVTLCNIAQFVPENIDECKSNDQWKKFNALVMIRNVHNVNRRRRGWTASAPNWQWLIWEHCGPQSHKWLFYLYRTMLKEERSSCSQQAVIKVLPILGIRCSPKPKNFRQSFKHTLTLMTLVTLMALMALMALMSWWPWWPWWPWWQWWKLYCEKLLLS